MSFDICEHRMYDTRMNFGLLGNHHLLHDSDHTHQPHKYSHLHLSYPHPVPRQSFVWFLQCRSHSLKLTWSRAVYINFCLTCFIQQVIIWRVITHVAIFTHSCSFQWWSSLPSDDYVIHLLMDAWVASRWGFLQRKALWTFPSKPLPECAPFMSLRWTSRGGAAYLVVTLCLHPWHSNTSGDWGGCSPILLPRKQHDCNRIRHCTQPKSLSLLFENRKESFLNYGGVPLINLTHCKCSFIVF